MTQEDKELLLKDLCGRLPYGVKIKRIDKEYPEWSEDIELDYSYDVTQIVDNEWIPYLRPMSSMTEEEKKEFKNTFNGFFQYFNHGIISDSRVWDKNEAVFVGELSCSRLIDWLNAHYFDYRGLIEKGFAIAVTEENNKQ